MIFVRVQSMYRTIRGDYSEGMLTTINLAQVQWMNPTKDEVTQIVFNDRTMYARETVKEILEAANDA